MRIALLLTSTNVSAEKGFYNSQEIGLARVLDKAYDEVIIYKACTGEEKKTAEKLEGCKNTTLIYNPMKTFGGHGLINTQILDSTLDVLIYFSDTQLKVSSVYKWAKKHEVVFFPYIGVVDSHSTSRVKRTIMNLLFKRSMNVYKKCFCLAKTPSVQHSLEKGGVKNISVVPVGLDMTNLKMDYFEYNSHKLREKYGISKDEKVILFIGRLEEEKQPIRMLEIIKILHEKDEKCRLIMVGRGKLKQEIEQKIKIYNLENSVVLIERISNNEIWKLYRISDVFVNLNRQEIFGMAILEAMYYECTVVAIEAPGPSFIIENGVSGYVVKNEEEIIKKITDNSLESFAIHETIVEKFTWEITFQTLEKLISLNKYNRRYMK